MDDDPEPTGTTTTQAPTTDAGATTSRFSEVPTDALADRLSRWASSLAAAECEFLDLLAEFDARQAWGESGMRSTAHWLSWRLGLRLGVAREKVRVARALQRLPLVHDEFAAGTLSYCKVRALSRVATDATEAELVHIARGATGAQLETVVRQWRRTLIGDTTASSHIRRGLRKRIEDDGSYVVTVRLSPVEGPVFAKAIALARTSVLDEAGQVVETPEEAALADALAEDSPWERSEADAFVLIASSFLAHGPSGEAGDRHLVLVHADIDTLAEACRSTADAGGPADAGGAAGEPSSNGSAETSSPAEDSPDRDTDERSRSVSAETSGLTQPSFAAHEPIAASGSVHQESYARRPATCVTEDGQPISASTVLRMLCDSPAQLLVTARDGRPLDLGRTSRNADRRQRRAIRVRDGGFCRFPGCSQRHRLIPHHTRWWSRGGRTDLDLLVSVCPTHHLAVHELGYDVTALGGGRFAWYRPDGQEISAAPTLGDEVATSPGSVVGPAAAAGDSSRSGGQRIVPMWGGERIDLDHLLGGMAANLLNDAGHRLTDIPYSALDQTLRTAAGWPAAQPGHRPFEGPLDANAA